MIHKLGSPTSQTGQIGSCHSAHVIANYHVRLQHPGIVHCCFQKHDIVESAWPSTKTASNGMDTHALSEIGGTRYFIAYRRGPGENIDRISSLRQHLRSETDHWVPHGRGPREQQDPLHGTISLFESVLTGTRPAQDGWPSRRDRPMTNHCPTRMKARPSQSPARCGPSPRVQRYLTFLGIGAQHINNKPVHQ